MNVEESTSRHLTIATDSLRASEQYDLWVHLLNETYGSWQVPRHQEAEFFASIQMSSFDDVSVAQVVCDPCSGIRKVSSVPQDETEHVVLQLTRSGHENFLFENNHYVLNPGDIMIWDSTRNMEFEVIERLEKVSLIIPLQRLRDWLPRDWRRIPRRIEASSAEAAILRSYILSLTGREVVTTPMRGEHLAEAAVALLAGSVGSESRSDTNSARASKLKLIKSYITKNLGDPELNLENVANRNGISKRYLHWLFKSSDETPARYIQRLRLERCRRDLENSAMASRPIGDIAYSWGFCDPMHFSRVFKSYYGLRPSDIRSGRSQIS